MSLKKSTQSQEKRQQLARQGGRKTRSGWAVAKDAAASVKQKKIQKLH